jgi:hypothetical protein
LEGGNTFNNSIGKAIALDDPEMEQFISQLKAIQYNA